MDETDEIIQEFVVESHENLDQLDRDLVELEQQPGSRELLASIFRTIHTIKGTSGFLGFHRLESVTHVGENLLAKLRDGKFVMTPTTTDVLLRMVDTVRALLDSIENTGVEGEVAVSEVVAAIQAILDGQAEAAAEAAPSQPGTAQPEAAETATAAAAPAAAEESTGSHPAVQEPAAAPALASAMAASSAAAPPPPAPAPLQEPAQETQVATVPVQRQEPVPESPAAPAESGPATTHKRTAAESSVRVDVDLLDSLMRQVGELVLARNQIVRMAAAGQEPTLLRASQRLNLIASELQEGVMKTRMQPVDHVWSKFPRVVRDLGNQLGKQVNLEMVGKETELDRTLLEAVKDPLTHLVRNAVDHGIESAEDRRATGKNPVGTLTLRAYHQGGQVVVEVSDDGAGIDANRLSAKAIDKGLKTQAQIEAMTQAELLQLIFLPGFSTAKAVTNVSGRGVGMDVVKTNIEAIGGTIEVESTLGMGTTCRLRIPLTLAIVPTLTVECAGDRYAIPQVSLLELVALDGTTNQVESVGGAPVYRLRGQLLPLVHLADVLGVQSDKEDGPTLIAVLQAEGKRFGLVIDKVLSTEEIVVKPLTSRLKSLGVYSGATILGDGTVALILDIQNLARQVLASDLAEHLAAQDLHQNSGAEGNRVLLASVGSDRRVAIPLSMVTRLERIPVATVEHVGNREVVQYRGAILPLLRLDQHLGASANTGEDLLMVVYTFHGRSVAIVVEEIIDIVEGEAEITSDIDDYGLLGSTVIKDKITELLDVRAAIVAADPQFFSHAPDEAATQEVHA